MRFRSAAASLVSSPLNSFSKRLITTTPQPSHKSFLRRHLGKGLLALSGVGVAFLAVEIYNTRHPKPQLPFDETKKTICVLGSGWAATSFLKGVDTNLYNIVVVSPRNYFLFTPLLPSCTVGTIEPRSIMQPMRYITRNKSREVRFVEADCTKINHKEKTIVIEDNSETRGEVFKQTLSYDYLIVACGAENATFNVPGVKEHTCFLKEIGDSAKIRTKLMDCVETAAFPGQPEKEVERLLNMIVVGGGPTGIEYAAELHDFLIDDLAAWYPDISSKVKITVIEALPHVLPMFSKELIDYTEALFLENKVAIRSLTQVKEVKEKEIVVMNANKETEVIPYGMVVWATGNAARPVIQDFMKDIGTDIQNQRRGLCLNDHLQVNGCVDVFALGDASVSKYPPTAQVASKQGKYLAEKFNRMGYLELEKDSMETNGVSPEEVIKLLPSFTFKTEGMLAYIGSDRAIADLPGGYRIGGLLTFYFWRSAYLSNLFSWRNRLLVVGDWVKSNIL